MSTILFILIGLWLAKGLIEVFGGLIQIALGLICGTVGILLTVIAVALDGVVRLWEIGFTGAAQPGS